MVLLGDGGQVEARFSTFEDSVRISAREVHDLCQTRLGKSFRKHPMELLGDEAQVEFCFSPFGDSVSISAR